MGKELEYDNEYYQRAAVLLEILRAEIGYGYATDDIENIGLIVTARLRQWDKLDQEKINRVEAKKISKYLRGIGLVNAAKDIETGEYER
jgi:hypothetical protein